MPPAPRTRWTRKRPSSKEPTESGNGRSPASVFRPGLVVTSSVTTGPLFLKVRAHERDVLRRQSTMIEQELEQNAFERVAIQIEPSAKVVLVALHDRRHERRVRLRHRHDGVH